MQSKAGFWKVVAGLVLFSAAFGYVEAAVVAYLRTIYAPLRAHFFAADRASDLFPLLSLAQLNSLGPEHLTRVKIELGRELATLLMLGGVGLTAARGLRDGVAAFLVCFGIWDITFYLFLRLLLHWPASLLTWDILFLLPVPWVGPVIAPVLVAASMIICGLIVMWREHDDRPVQLTARSWAGILLGGVLIVAAFMWDFPNTANGGNPNPFHWPLFFLGEAIGLLAFGASLRTSSKNLFETKPTM
jgi:hypothetical protein